jgi:tetrahydromethanopterin S-methyltransferase subunit B
MAQMKIKEAVLADESTSTPHESQSYTSQENYQQSYSQGQEQYHPQQSNQQQGYPEYQQQYDPYSSGISTDTISEIAEQVVLEKLSPLKEHIEQIISFKTTIEARMESLDERLKRMEKIIDRLQLSILQKVGEYITNVDDIKKEIGETQKSFRTLLSENHHRKG